METNGNNVINAATAAEPGGPLPTPEAIIEQLRAVRAQIADYVHLSNADANLLRRAAFVTPAFVDASIHLVGAFEPIQGVLGRTESELREENEAAGRWASVEDELRTMLRGVAATNLVRRHRIGLTALQAYQIGRQLARKKGNEALLPQIEKMKQVSKFVTGKRLKPTTQPAPAPAPQPTPTPTHS